MKAAIVALVLACAACGSSNDTTAPDSGTPDAGVGQAACVANPVTSTDILNACTDAGFVDKKPVIPNLLPDGGLPPLQ
ncbi:MAG TPA: hypothetical protein VGH20_15325 [Myxococcales bacterium]|jgi:hypothetical protein